MNRTKTITRLVILISLTLAIEMVGLPQPITGPLVNTMLLLTTLLLNVTAGIVLGIITPLTAVIRGQLPPVFLPMVPFIVAANILLVSIFGILIKTFKTTKLHNKTPLLSPAHWIGLLAGSTVKFLFLYYSAKTLVPLMFGKNFSPQFLAMMALPQFITAVIGGAFAFFLAGILIKILK